MNIGWTKEGTVSGDSQFMVSEYDLLASTNTFDVEALSKTLDYLMTKNYWALYQNQKSRINMQRFDIPIKRFKMEWRTQYEDRYHMFSRRFIFYVKRPFVHYTRTVQYRYSEFFEKPVNQETIGKHREIFSSNFLLFVDGELVTTCEVLPLEAETGIIIDLESMVDKHGVSFKQYDKWLKDEATVTVFFLPNFEFTDSVRITKHTVLDVYQREVPFTYVGDVENNDMDHSQLNWNTITFHNNPIDYHVKRMSQTIQIATSEQKILFGDMTEFRETPTIDLSFINFNPEITNSYVVEGREPYFRLDLKMPCPKDQLLVFVKTTDGYTQFAKDIQINQYYHNIYELVGLAENETALVYVFYTERGVGESETYFRQIALYEKYFDLILQFKNKTIHEVIKNYKPFEFKYNEPDYMKFHADVTPSVYSYEIDKMRNAIEEDPWTLWAYLLFLGLSAGKYFVFMEEIDLAARVRMNTAKEDVDSGHTVYFEEPYYLFSINRSYLTHLHWGFRFFLDGLFLNDDSYVIREGMDYYYFYFPARLFKEDSVLEIEKYRMFEFYAEKVFLSTMDNYELNLDKDMGEVVCVGDIYLIDMETNEFLKPEDYVVSIKTTFINSKKEIITGYRDCSPTSMMHPREKSYIRLLNRSYFGKRIQIGIHKDTDMVVGKPYLHEPFTDGMYATMRIKNEGNYNKGNFRVFRNGRFCEPDQYLLRVEDDEPRKFGENLEVMSLVATKMGDQLTIDRVPCTFRVVYYQPEIEEGGYVDLDGAVNLPVSLKWYDIYLNGVRLNPKNLFIVSPTRFWIRGVTSRKNLVIVDRDRNDDVFFLQPHYFYDDYEDDRNNTIIDDILDVTDLKGKIDDTLPDDDDDNSHGIIDPDCVDGIIFFEEYMKYTFIDANLRQLADEYIKKRFKKLFTEEGVMPVDANIHPTGEYIKFINCNEGVGD